MTEQAIGEAVWSGDYWGPEGAIVRARREYHKYRIYFSELPPRETTDTQLAYLNALYSAFGSVYPAARRGNMHALGRAVYTLRKIRPFLKNYAKDATDRIRSGEFSADQKEMLGAMLVKFAETPLIGGHVYREAAVEYAKAALHESRDEHGSHTPLLAALTLARADIAVEGKDGHADQHLRFAAKHAAHVTDANQKARILRSLAELYHTLGDRPKALVFIKQAEDVPGISEDVRAKTKAVKDAIWL